MQLYWHYPGGQTGPYTFRIVMAPDHPGACRAFGVAPGSTTVRSLDMRTRLAHAWANLHPGDVRQITETRLPMSRDFFDERGYR